MDEVRSYVRLDLPLVCGKAVQKIVPPHLRIPSWKGLGADSGEKHELASGVDTAVVDSLKALDLKRPIREADIILGRPALASRIRATDLPINQNTQRQLQWQQSLHPAEFLHGQARVPYLGHVSDLIAVELHDVSIV